jgi:4-oxalocrotonate tautomerase
MPVITVQLLAGRTTAEKREFIRQLTDLTVRALVVPEQAVTIVLAEVDADDWGAGGMTMAVRRGATA